MIYRKDRKRSGSVEKCGDRGEAIAIGSENTQKNAKKPKKPGLTAEEIRTRIVLAAEVLLLCFTICLAATGRLFRETVPNSGASFLFLSVGQASCSVILTERGSIMLDTGSNASEETVLAALAHYGIASLDLLVLSHADEDHAGGLDRILETLPVSRVALTKGTLTALAGSYGGDALRAAEASGATEILTVSAGARLSVGELMLEALTPAENNAAIMEGGNESSLVLLVSYGETNAIFPGDADTEGETRALEYLERFHGELSCEILAVGHHGSSSSSGEAFVRFLRPQYSIISCGKDNTYGHPTSTVLDRFSEVGSTVCRTDLEGTVLLHTDGETLTRLR